MVSGLRSSIIIFGMFLVIVGVIVFGGLRLSSESIVSDQDRHLFGFPYVLKDVNDNNIDFGKVKGYSLGVSSNCYNPKCGGSVVDVLSGDVLVTSISLPNCNLLGAGGSNEQYDIVKGFSKVEGVVDGSVLRKKDVKLVGGCGDSVLNFANLVVKVDCVSDVDCENTAESQLYSVQGVCDLSLNKCRYGFGGVISNNTGLIHKIPISVPSQSIKGICANLGEFMFPILSLIFFVSAGLFSLYLLLKKKGH